MTRFTDTELGTVVGSDRIPAETIGGEKGHHTADAVADHAIGRLSASGALCWINAGIAPYSATGDGTTDDLAAIQAALDAASAAGGGTVYLPAGVYLCSGVLSVPSYVHLTGAGFASIIRNPAGSLPGKTISSITVYASIAMIGAIGAKVSRLTVDHATNLSHANGIQIGEFGAAVVSTDCIVEECQLLGFEDHQYLIYNKLADRTRILNNRCIGHSSVSSEDTAGVEVFGGVGVEVAGNDILNCSPGIVVKSETGITGSDLRAIDVHDNRIEGALNGLQVVGINGFTLIDINVHHNVITGVTNRGLFVSIESGCTAENVLVNGNIVRNSGSYDIAIENDDTGTQGIVVADNIMSNDDTAAICFYTDGLDMLVSGNMVSGQPRHAYFLNGANNVTMLDNSSTGSNEDAIRCENSTNIAFIDNTLTNYGKGGAIEGISARTGSGMRFQGNYFKYATSHTTAIDAQTCTDVEFKDNVLGWYQTGPAFQGSNTASSTAPNWHPSVMMRGDGYVHVSGNFQKSVGFNAAKTDVPLKPIDIIWDNLRLRAPVVPANASATGLAGEIAWDANYIYVCVATDTWKRVAIATW